eukprot:COSAG01_NODE_48209_length_383_cov_0.890845_1_plen_92_part_00
MYLETVDGWLKRSEMLSLRAIQMHRAARHRRRLLPSFPVLAARGRQPQDGLLTCDVRIVPSLVEKCVEKLVVPPAEWTGFRIHFLDCTANS